jgi:hypothetical protein
MHELMFMRMHVHMDRSPNQDGHMQGLSRARRGAVSRIGLPLYGISAGGLGTVALVCGHNVALAVACGLGAAAPGVVTALCNGLPGIIEARSEADTKREQARQRTLLIEAGLGQNLDAATLLKLQPLDAEVLKDPRCGDAALRALLPGPRVPSASESNVTVVLSSEAAAPDQGETGEGDLLRERPS